MDFQINRNSISSFFIEFILYFLIFFSPLLQAGVPILPLSVIEAMSFLLLYVFCLKSVAARKVLLVKIPALFLFLFLSVILFQLFQLPRWLISLFSPATINLFKDFRIIPFENMHLSIYPEATIEMFLQAICFLAVFFVTLNYFDTEKKIKRIFWVLISCGLLYALYGVIRRIWVAPPEFSTFANRNHFAAYTEIIILLTLAYSLTVAQRSKRIILIFVAAVISLSLFLSLSRAGVISLSFGLLIFGLSLRIKAPVKMLYSILIALFLLLAFFIVTINFGTLLGERFKTLLSPFNAYSSRFLLVKDSLAVIGDFPLFGSGLGTFYDIFQKYRTFPNEFSDYVMTFYFAHNEPVQLAVETGILGFAFAAFFIFNYFRGIFRVWLKRNNHFVVFMVSGLFAGMAAVFMHSLFDFVFHIPAVMLVFSVAFALVFRVVYLRQGGNTDLPVKEFKFTRYYAVASVIVFTVSLILAESLVWRRFQAAELFERAKTKKTALIGVDRVIEYMKGLKLIDRANDLDPFNANYPAGKAGLLSELATSEDLKQDVFNSGKFKDQAQLLSAAENSYKEAIQLNPTQAEYHLKLGWLYNVGARPEPARAEFRKAILLDPQNNNIRAYLKSFPEIAQ